MLEAPLREESKRTEGVGSTMVSNKQVSKKDSLLLLGMDDSKSDGTNSTEKIEYHDFVNELR